MNKSYKSVWNETTGTYVAASETARSRGKKNRSQKALVAALVAAGVGFGTAVKSEAAATPNSFAVGVLGTDASNSDCISSADGAVVTTNNDCSATTQQAGIVSFNSSGTAGAYFTVTDPNTAHIGAGGIDQMTITNNGLFVLNTLNMGGNKITNLAAGAVSASSTDAVNGAQLFGITNTFKVNGTSAAAITNTGDIAIGSGASTSYQAGTGTGDIAIGSGAIAGASGGSGQGVAIGANANASFGTGGNGTAIGANSIASGGVAVGMSAYSGYKTNVVVGNNAYAKVMGATVLGTSATVTGTSAVAIGMSSSASAANSVAIGSSSLANRANTVSVGASGATRQVVNVAAGTQATDAVNYAQLQAAGLKVDTSGNATNAFVAYDDTTQGKVTLGGASGTTLTNVAAGAITASSKDAVNGSQLYTTNQNVTQNAAAIAQNASDISTNAGNIAQNTSDIGTLNSQVSNIDGEMADVVKYDTSAHDTVTLGGASGTTLTNVAAGEVSESSTDAVTGAQLWNTNQQLSDLTQSVQNQQQTGSSAMSINTGSQPAAAATGNNAVAVGGGSQASGDNSVAIGSGSVADEANTVSVGSQGNERRITNVANGTAATDAVNLGQMQSAIGDTARAAYSGVAAATALTMIPEVDPGKTLAVGVAGGTYKGYQAAAVGASARITQNLKVKLGAGISGSETTVGAGASYQW